MADYLTISEFALQAGVSKQAVYKRLDKDLQPLVQLVDGKKVLPLNALELFRVNESTPPVEQPVEKTVNRNTTDQLVELLNTEVERLTNQNEKLTNQLESTGLRLDEERTANKEMQQQVLKLATDFAELARQSNQLTSQAQQLQGHLQDSTLSQPVDVVGQLDGQVDQPEKKTWFQRLFNR